MLALVQLDRRWTFRHVPYLRDPLRPETLVESEHTRYCSFTSATQPPRKTSADSSDLYEPLRNHRRSLTAPGGA